MTEDERTLFEERLLTDQELSDAVAVCEQELIDEYATGSLTPAEAASLREWMETSPRRMQRIRMAQTLLKQRPWESHRRWRLATILAVAACLVTAIGVTLHFLSRMPAERSIASAPKTIRPAESVSSSTKSSVSGNSVKSPEVILLVSENIRGKEPLVTYRIRPDVPVELQVLLVGGPESGTYNLQITSSHGNQQKSLLKRNNLHPLTQAGHSYIDASFPPGIFPPAIYEVVVSGGETILVSKFAVTQ
jgi:hypothetical protein